MRLSNGFVIDKEKTFGELKFTAVRDVFLQNEDGTPSTQLKKRIYGQAPDSGSARYCYCNSGYNFLSKTVTFTLCFMSASSFTCVGFLLRPEIALLCNPVYLSLAWHVWQSYHLQQFSCTVSYVRILD